MAILIQAVRGMNDILPDETPYWLHVEDTVRRVLSGYGYQQIRLPVVEKTELFCRSIGEVTDIVEKEMYTFQDRNGDSLTLRPEGTAGCVRAVVERGLLGEGVQRLWYTGPMFRHERPQKGRYRQFHQVGVEVFGIETADLDAELILMTARLWRELGLLDVLELQINSLGSHAARSTYRETLVAYFSAHLAQLDEDSQRRLHSNPLRILDSKNPDMQALLEAAPALQDALDDASRDHFAIVRGLLDAAGVKYRVNPRLVRGLDYYNRTVFEWVTDQLGAQGTVCAGGRYDTLVEQLGGRATPAVGFAMGLERLQALVKGLVQPDVAPHAYLIISGAGLQAPGMVLAEDLRSHLPMLRLVTHCGGGSFKSQFKKADKSGARVALVLGEDELAKGVVGVKFLREECEQQAVARGDLVGFLEGLI